MTTVDVHSELIPARDPRLGRHIEHDRRSWDYDIAQTVAAVVVKTTEWKRYSPILNQGSLGSCFPPGTRIRMADGSERAIEDVRLLDGVVTAEGNTGMVTSMMVRHEDGGLVRLLLWGHAHLRMTREHPVLTRRGYVPAGGLVVGDEVALPRYFSGRRVSIPVSEFVTTAVHRLGRGNRWAGVAGRSGLRVGANPVPEKIDLTPAAGRLLGLFLAEGACDAGKAKWCYGTHEAATLVAETVQLLRDEWGVEAYVQHRPNNSTFVGVYGTGWTRLLSGLCGDGAGMKCPHPYLMDGPSEFLEAMLEGWLAGDGHERVRYYKRAAVRSGIEGVTISRDLALAMYDIAQALGRRPVIDWRESSQNRHAAVRRPRWTVTMANMDTDLKSRQDEAHVWRKVRELRVEDYVGPVYNLSVEGDESYVAEGIGVHNCTGNAMAGWLATEPYCSSDADGSIYNEDFARKLYSMATKLDPYPGTWPPDDTGSSGNAVAKSARKLGLIRRYSWAFTTDGLIRALMLSPVIVGVPWFESMFNTDENGFVTAEGDIAGGHEFLIRGYDVDRRLFLADNSWGAGWGALNGSFRFTRSTWDVLRSQSADVTVPHV